MADTTKLKKYFLFGFVALILCGVGDWLIGYEPAGGEELIFGITRTTIASVPTWFYVLSLMFGVLSGFGCKYFAPAMESVVKSSGVSSESKMYRLFHFALSSAPMMFVSFHSVCCVVLLLIQASLKAGLDIYNANDIFFFPVAASMLPFTVWCYLCDIPATIAYIYFVIKGHLNLPKAAIIFAPVSMSFAAKIIGAILIAIGSPLAFLIACGESWGWGFMCLAFYLVVVREERKRNESN
jgi:hypothetical protein